MIRKEKHHKFKKIISIFLILVFFSILIYSCGIPIIVKYAFSVSTKEDNKATAKIYYSLTPKDDYGIVPAPKLYFLYTVKNSSSGNAVAITDSTISSYFKAKFNDKPTNIGTPVSSNYTGFMFYKSSSSNSYSSSKVKDMESNSLSSVFDNLENNSKYDKASTIGVYFNSDSNKQQTLPIEFNKEILYECTLDQQDITKKEYTIKVKTTNGINSSLSVFLHDFKGSKFTLDGLRSSDYSLMDNRINNTIIEVYAVVCSGNEGSSSTNISFSKVFKIASFDLNKQ